MSKIIIGLPTYDNRTDTRQGLFLYGARTDNLNVVVRARQISALCWNFNTLYAEALNDRDADYFLLIHADIVPYDPTFWIRKLISELNGANADILSAVVPVKNKTGITSTAAQSAEHPTPRRLTMREAYQLPVTFKARDIAELYGWSEHKDQQLLVNTGCMLLDLRRKRNVFEKMYFYTRDGIEKRDGKFVATFAPEDWNFARDAHANGLTLAATRAVKVMHSGHADYDNASAWGELEHDTLENIGT